MSFEWFIAKRYLWSKRRHPFVGVMGTISVLGIAVGVAALIVVLAVMNGFDEDLKARIIGTRAHLVIEKEAAFNDAGFVIQKLRAIEEIKGASVFVEGQALVQIGEWGTGVLVRGVDTKRERSVSRFYDYIVRGTLSDRPDGVAVGSELAKRARLRIGSRLQLATQTTKKPIVVTVEGIFSSGMYEYDANLIFLNLKNAQALFDLGDSVSGVSVYLKNADKATAVKKSIREKLAGPYRVHTWIDMNRTFFSALKLEKTAMFIILALIVLVACFNIAGSLTMMVMDKTRDIGVLRALGATPASLMKIFALDGILLGVVGAGTGFAAGSGICLLLKNYSFVELPKEVYYITRLPVKMGFMDTSLILIVAVSLSFLSAVYPAIMAGRLDPVKALRYE